MRDAIDTVRQFSRRVYHSYCFYCGVQLAHKKLSRFSRKPGTPHSSLANEFWWDTATFDHWIPKSNGGGHKHKVPCCLRCNRQKVALDVEDWRVVFFGAHVGKFWGEELAERVRALPARPMKELPPPIPFCGTCGSIDRWETRKRYASLERKKSMRDEIGAALRELSMALGNPAFEFEPDEMEAGLIRYAANWIKQRIEEEKERIEMEEILESAERDLLPKMTGSRMSLALFDGRVNAKFCLEIGAAICLDKPLILAALKDDKLPGALERAATAIVRGDPTDPKVKVLLSEAITQALGKAG